MKQQHSNSSSRQRLFREIAWLGFGILTAGIIFWQAQVLCDGLEDLAALAARHLSR